MVQGKRLHFYQNSFSGKMKGDLNMRQGRLVVNEIIGNNNKKFSKKRFKYSSGRNESTLKQKYYEYFRSKSL